jgi:hypothetical protein
VHSAIQQERQPIHLTDSTGGQRSLLSVLQANMVVLAPLAKTACHAIGQPVAPSSFHVLGKLSGATCNLDLINITFCAPTLSKHDPWQPKNSPHNLILPIAYPHARIAFWNKH